MAKIPPKSLLTDEEINQITDYAKRSLDSGLDPWDIFFEYNKFESMDQGRVDALKKVYLLGLMVSLFYNPFEHA